MEYIRQVLEFVPVGPMSRARGILRAEVRDQTLKIRIQLENMPPAPFGTYGAEMICVKNGYYKRSPLGMIRTDNRGRGELLYRQSLGNHEGPGVEDFQTFIVQRLRPTPTELMIARIDNGVNWHELPEWGSTNNNEETPPKPEVVPVPVSKPEPEPTTIPAPEPEPVPEPIPQPRPQTQLQNYLMEKMPRIRPFYQSALKWIRLDPADLSPLPMDLNQLESSPFVMNGYTRYKHLILGRDQKNWQLGVPYRYFPEMVQIAAEQDFHEFRPAHGQAAKKGDFGYWIRHIPLEKN
ncbi:MAG: hypothetical protein IJ315_02180 [Firmicutes bacterium]|nr:hypothetical protein [Bacillota bacterium]